jgi:LuxR family transcriptional regulator, maltose regulon positive regulatory protein
MSELLAPKFNLPVPARATRATRTLIDRSHLSRAIEEGLRDGSRLVLVSAPAGFGKTTCVAAWLAHSRREPISWLSLDAGDDQAARFFLYLIAALQRSRPDLGKELEGILRSGQVPPIEVIVAALVNELDAGSSLTLVLDDFHVLTEASILDGMERLIANLPANLTLVLITREDPPFSLARLRANGLLIEIRAEDLRFTHAETQAFLTGELKLPLSDRQIEILEERTEGWAVGLQLAALSIRGQLDPSAFITSLSGSQRYILNYLVEEVLNRQPEDLRDFLLETSILERFNAGLCDALTGRRDSRKILKRLQQANLFLIPLDQTGEWFRYHHLFADLLRDQLSALGSEHTAALHRQAADWYSSADQPLEAIDHALAAGDHALAVELLEGHAIGLLFQGQSSRVEACLKAIPPLWRARSLRTSLACTWLYIFRGNFEKAMFYYQQLAAVLSVPGAAADLAPAVQAEWLALQAMLASGQGQPEAAIRMAEQALAIAPPTDAYVLTLIYMSLAGAYQALDDFPRAVEAHRQIIHHGSLTENFDSEVMGYAGLCQIVLNHGHYHSGFEIVTRGIRRVEEAGRMPPITAALYGSLGEIYFQWNQTEKAIEYYRRSARLSHLCGYSDGEVCFHAIQSRRHLLEGDLPAAEAEIGAGLELMKRVTPAWVKEVALAQQVRVMLAAGRLDAAEAAYAGMAPEPQPSFHLPRFADGQKLTPASGYLYTSALRILLHRAENRGELDALTHGLTLAVQLIEAARKGEFVVVAIETILLQARMLLLRGEPSAARDCLAQALTLGEAEEIVRVFVEGGEAICALLSGLSKETLPEGISRAYIERILAGVPAPNAKPSSQSGSEPFLTGREREVLRLMSRGLTYEEMAAELVISLNTVRSHVKAIYGKLGADNRTQAIACARRSGLLEP